MTVEERLEKLEVQQAQTQSALIAQVELNAIIAGLLKTVLGLDVAKDK